MYNPDVGTVSPMQASWIGGIAFHLQSGSNEKYDTIWAGERDEIQSKFSESILAMQQKSALKYLILEKKISAMKEEIDVKDAQLHAMVEQGVSKKGKMLMKQFAALMKDKLAFI